jgi:hypothetical protein
MSSLIGAIISLGRRPWHGNLLTPAVVGRYVGSCKSYGLRAGSDAVAEASVPKGLPSACGRRLRRLAERKEPIMNDFLAFRKMITPTVIQVLFWIGAVLSVIMALFMLIGGAVKGEVGTAIAGLLCIVLGPIMVRIYCELIIVTFRILDMLVDIKKNTERPGGM